MSMQRLNHRLSDREARLTYFEVPFINQGPEDDSKMRKKLDATDQQQSREQNRQQGEQPDEQLVNKKMEAMETKFASRLNAQKSKVEDANETAKRMQARVNVNKNADMAAELGIDMMPGGILVNQQKTEVPQENARMNQPTEAAAERRQTEAPETGTTPTATKKTIEG